ncbi:MAG: FAD-dependent oxidoreductase [Bacteroidales bacterium]|nr:FAD-dependent oxidoreductase [Bacteroidales bacterium]
MQTRKGFGLTKDLVFQSEDYKILQTEFMNQTLDTPFGVAAGPHTQLSQNILMAWLSGARYIELKTVQVLDELEVSKPCIDMQDEGYNCEWSQELKIEESFNEYLNAWILIHLFQYQKNKHKSPGLIFNMSVGYNYDGILSDKVQWYLDKMNNCSVEKKNKIEALSVICPEIKDVEIPDCISNNVTLSTMHGCPPDEIEKITSYLVKERKLNTILKLNPTLLGKDALRNILNTQNGFYTEVPDIAFEHDLKYEQALGIIERLTAAAAENHVFFGLKLTNTLESLNTRQVFSKSQESMYMSGRALHPISINLAKKIQENFNGRLQISFSAGADCFNLPDVLACGLFPVTVSSDVLKPGGYSRLLQYAKACKDAYIASNAMGREEFIKNKNVEKDVPEKEAALANLKLYAQNVLEQKAYKNDFFIEKSIKTNKELGVFDCINAPCTLTCPTHQDIPEYMFHASKGQWENALLTILRTNPFPNVLGMICDHKCQTKCTRINYDEELRIRDVKWFVSHADEQNNMPENLPAKGLKAAVIGAGPSGLSCAYFLKLAGMDVAVFESKSVSGGMISEAIPNFRLKEAALKKDIDRIKNMGVAIHYNARINTETFNKLRETYNCVYIAVGAQENKKLNIEGEHSEGVLDPIQFLSSIKKKENLIKFKNIAIIGGGNTACDIARSAHRLLKGEGKVTVVYRRTLREMPADKEELEAMLSENIEVVELTAPLKIISKNGKVSALACIKMSQGENDESGRSKPVPIQGSDFELPFDAIIPALGQHVVVDFMEKEAYESVTAYQTAVDGVFIGGDALRGASTIINAVGDGRKASSRIISTLAKNITENNSFSTGLSYEELIEKKSVRKHSVLKYPAIAKYQETAPEMPFSKEDIMEEAARCLFCHELCNICVTVCPNKANYCYEVKPFSMMLPKLIVKDGKYSIEPHKTFEVKQKYQIINIGDFCNECGNCNTFCPTSGAPYQQKPKVYLTSLSFISVEEAYLLSKHKDKSVLVYKKKGLFSTLTSFQNKYLYETDYVKVEFDADFKIIHVETLAPCASKVTFEKAAEMYVLINGISNLC